jgi:hypothetical protein
LFGGITEALIFHLKHTISDLIALWVKKSNITFSFSLSYRDSVVSGRLASRGRESQRYRSGTAIWGFDPF